MKIIAVIPAHNEAASITGTVRSLLVQGLAPEEIVVVSDNSSDGTEQVARAAGVWVIRTAGNRWRKAGALNQALALVLPGLGAADAVLVMDADTELADGFVAHARRRLLVRTELGAVGAVFRARDPHGLLGWMQANEWTRYGRKIDRTGKVAVLSGTAAVIRVPALRGIAQSRGRKLPGETGDVYDRAALTEDNELTLALKTLGWALESPARCASVTELMPSVRALLRQRVRWYRGALENLPRYGMTRVTRGYWFQQGMLALTTAMMVLYLVLTVAVLAGGRLHVSVFWSVIGAVFWVERVATVWPAGWRARALAALVFLEMAYDLVLMSAFVLAVGSVLLGRKAVWHHAESRAAVAGV
jgi:cellulose synthase/poly-beta-1,6-N-acetylglucosamine synthase-like glycosyltransferase